MIFRDRLDAGNKLAKVLEKYKGKENTLIIALPRGGVVVGKQIAEKLNLPLDIVVPRKIGAPDNPEFAIGAITESGQGIFDQKIISNISPEYLHKEIAKEKKEAQRRLKKYRGNKKGLDLENKTVILTDDGMATGQTMRAAIQSLKKAKRIILAIPVATKDTIEKIRKEIDEIICLHTPLLFYAVGQFYEHFEQVTDEEVVNLLK